MVLQAFRGPAFDKTIKKVLFPPKFYKKNNGTAQCQAASSVLAEGLLSWCSGWKRGLTGVQSQCTCLSSQDGRGPDVKQDKGHDHTGPCKRTVSDVDTQAERMEKGTVYKWKQKAGKAILVISQNRIQRLTKRQGHDVTIKGLIQDQFKKMYQLYMHPT